MPTNKEFEERSTAEVQDLLEQVKAWLSRARIVTIWVIFGVLLFGLGAGIVTIVLLSHYTERAVDNANTALASATNTLHAAKTTLVTSSNIIGKASNAVHKVTKLAKAAESYGSLGVCRSEIFGL